MEVCHWGRDMWQEFVLTTGFLTASVYTVLFCCLFMYTGLLRWMIEIRVRVKIQKSRFKSYWKVLPTCSSGRKLRFWSSWDQSEELLVSLFLVQ